MKNKNNASTGSAARTTAQLILAATLIFTACKKKEDKTTEPTPTPAPVATTNPVTATVSGVSFTTGVWYNNGVKDLYRMFFSKNGTKIGFSAFKGNTGTPSNGEGIELEFPYGVGTYTLGQTNVGAWYYGYYNVAKDTISNWNANTATISITQIDTNGAGSNIVKTLKGTFTYSTSLNKGKTFNVTNGVIDYSK